MKKIFYNVIFIIVLTFFLNLNIVCADSAYDKTCLMYNDNNSEMPKSLDLKIKYNGSDYDYEVNLSNTVLEDVIEVIHSSYVYGPNLSKSIDLSNLEKGKCYTSLVLCKKVENDSGGDLINFIFSMGQNSLSSDRTYWMIFYDNPKNLKDSLQLNDYWKDGKSTNEYDVFKKATCATYIGRDIGFIEEKSPETNENVELKPIEGLQTSCEPYNKITQKILESYNEYTTCINNKKTNCSSTLSKFNKSSEKLESYCRNVMENSDYISACMKPCLNVNEYINFYKNIFDKGDYGTQENDCGFSGKLLAWISNILRWIKYILPVGVILLGILDFIKAVAADKDDEMKKAQGRFIKRLIAAALVFIIPLIIEFILEKMGFGYDSCSLF